ncbi:MAG: glycosyltransferase family 2 protein [Patescibacteria group bacterium]|nr:glycosyltransferase family 2 protein [Patescibacteria group bacterium]
MRVIGVIPAYNEEKRIAAVLRESLAYLNEIIVVDDGSTDETSRAAMGTDECGRVCVLRHAINRNQGAALRTGTKAALMSGADIIVHLDADGQHDAKDLPNLLQPVLDGSTDVVLGSRFLGVQATGMPLARRWLLKCGRWFNILALGISRQVTDPQSGLRAMTAEAARQIVFHQDGKAHASEILRSVTRSGLRWMEIPAHVIYTQDSLNKAGSNRTSDAIKIAWHLLVGTFTK